MFPLSLTVYTVAQKYVDSRKIYRMQYSCCLIQEISEIITRLFSILNILTLLNLLFLLIVCFFMDHLEKIITETLLK